MQFTIEGELKNTDEADNTFYNRIKSLKKELEAENIPGTKKGPGQERSERMRSVARSKTELNWWRSMILWETTEYEAGQREIRLLALL